MARVDVSDGWTAVGSVSSVQSALNTFLGASGMWVVGEQAGEVHARQGWWLARVLSGRLVPAAWLPQLAVIKFQSGDGGVAVRASIEEASPAGRLSPQLMDKYRAHFDRWMGGLKAALR